MLIGMKCNIGHYYDVVYIRLSLVWSKKGKNLNWLHAV